VCSQTVSVWSEWAGWIRRSSASLIGVGVGVGIDGKRGAPDGDGEDSRRGAEALRVDREDRECRNVESATALDSRQRPALKGGLDQGIVFTHPHGLVENATAPSAGGAPVISRPNVRNPLATAPSTTEL
jgi:hypothetical protein